MLSEQPRKLLLEKNLALTLYSKNSGEKENRAIPEELVVPAPQ
jgi:hypothetical protein